MSDTLTDSEALAAAIMSADRRYEYCVEEIAVRGEVWSLKSDEGWVVMTTQEGEECLPVWPRREFAAQWADGDWADCTPEAIPLAVWMERWTPGLEQDGTLLAVFPHSDEEGTVVTPGEFFDALNKALP
ncbi:MAG: DUF2750 domain-containing protein [Gammaproteobacteria bacterium]|nr:DUF2750 domain-containing protein [Gammaproteobacteria bacterium]